MQCSFFLLSEVNRAVIPVQGVVVRFVCVIVAVEIIVRKKDELRVCLFEEPARKVRHERAVKTVIRHHFEIFIMRDKHIVVEIEQRNEFGNLEVVQNRPVDTFLVVNIKDVAQE